MRDFEKFYNYSLRFLSYRPRSEKEVRDRLELKISHFAKASRDKQNSKLIDDIVKKLKKYNFINDVEFAKKWVESRLKFKPRSARLIKLELKQKGIEEDIIDKMINDEARLPAPEHSDGGQGLMINDLEQAKKLVEKRVGRLKGLSKEQIYIKLGRYLASKGFNWDTIKKSIDPVKS